MDKALSEKTKHTPRPWRWGQPDARLIEAASDLLAALKMLHDVVNEHVDSAVVTVPLGYSRAAIDKAEGGYQ